MSETRKGKWLQKILYFFMIALGIYIIGKGAPILYQIPLIHNLFERGTVQRLIEDSALRTVAPGYVWSIRHETGGSIKSGWMQGLVPVYSYLADAVETDTDTLAESTVDAQQGTGPLSEPTVDAQQATEILTESVADTETGREDASEAADAEPGREDVSEAAETGREEMSETTATETGREDVSETTDTEHATVDTETESGTQLQEAMAPAISQQWISQVSSYPELLNQFFTVDGGTSVDEQLLDGLSLVAEDLHIEKKPEVPQILIYHTHSQEQFADSVEGDVTTSIVGMGEVLADCLRTRYGYQVFHDTGVYDLVDGVLDRSAAYDYARASISEILDKYPSIEVVIDLHRDGVEGQKFVTQIEGKPTSMIMFFNGISRDSNARMLTYLQNPYIHQNLAFSLQLQLKAREQYPGFTRNIYLKAERFNLHLRPRSLLIEAGTQLNTVEEERNAMKPLAELIDQVLEGK